MDDMVEKLEHITRQCERLKELLTETPEIVEFIKATKEASNTGYETVKPLDKDVICNLLSAKEVAKILKVNENRVGEYAKEGLLPYCFMPYSSSRRFRVSDVNNFVEGCMQKG